MMVEKNDFFQIRKIDLFSESEKIVSKIFYSLIFRPLKKYVNLQNSKPEQLLGFEKKRSKIFYSLFFRDPQFLKKITILWFRAIPLPITFKSQPLTLINMFNYTYQKHLSKIFYSLYLLDPFHFQTRQFTSETIVFRVYL